MRHLRKAIIGTVVGVGLAVCAASWGLAQAQTDSRTAASNGASSRDLRAGFGRPETISGTISAVDQRGLLTLKREGPTEPATTQLTVTEPAGADQSSQGQSKVEASPGPGRTDYTFRITSSTKIRIGGESKSIADLASLEDRRATIQFIPRRSGNFASTINVTQ